MPKIVPLAGGASHPELQAAKHNYQVKDCLWVFINMDLATCRLQYELVIPFTSFSAVTFTEI